MRIIQFSIRETIEGPQVYALTEDGAMFIGKTLQLALPDPTGQVPTTFRWIALPLPDIDNKEAVVIPQRIVVSQEIIIPPPSEGL